jgi:hypothetical protein
MSQNDMHLYRLEISVPHEELSIFVIAATQAEATSFVMKQRASVWSRYAPRRGFKALWSDLGPVTPGIKLDTYYDYD